MADLSRRDLLKAAVVVASPAALAACGGDASSGTPPGSSEASAFFPQSVASGDPRPTSVVLWTRVFDADRGEADLDVELEVATDAEFAGLVPLDGGAMRALTADAESGGCVKVRVENLEPATVYYYRFSYLQAGERRTSRVGRTRTAPAPDADTPVRFAVVSCQDYGGKYFHVLRHLLEQDLDFVLHLGDYVYETTNDPDFQNATPDREMRFSEPEQALVLGDYLAARSLGNYRDLYRTVRSDPDLQRLHERFALLAIPDDHEFSNDCHGATATYTNGRDNEDDVERRSNADRAWFEYMPADYDAPPASALDETREFPQNLTLYRSFVFGRHLELVLTDLRRYRPDHLVPEQAFPGAVFMTASDAREILGEPPADAVAYVDIDAAENEAVRAALSDAAPSAGFDAERVAGFLSVPWINDVLGAAGGAPPFDPEDSAFERGYAYHQLLKSAEFSAFGVRYLVAEPPFRALAALRLRATGGASELLMGAEQRGWFVETLRASTRTFKVWGNEYTLMRRAIDLRSVTLAPPAFRSVILLSAEDWDGAPNERNALLSELRDVENLVVFTGDLHAFFAGTPYPEGDPDARVVEFVSGSVSSTTWQSGIERAIENDPSIPPEAILLAQSVGSLLQSNVDHPNPHIGWLDLEQNGYAFVSVGSDALEATLYTIDDALVATPADELAGALDDHFTALEFRVPVGTRALERRFDDRWKRWDLESQAWT